MIKVVRNTIGNKHPSNQHQPPGIMGVHPPPGRPHLSSKLSSHPFFSETYMRRLCAARAMAPLENPPESPCFGCGPHHARGLHLEFDRRTALDGAEEVVCEYTAKPDEIGWPGLMHVGLLFLVMMETSYWAALTLGGRVMTVRGPVTYEMLRLPRVGRTFQARARIESATAAGIGIRCVAEDAKARPHASMQSSWVRESRALVEKAGIRLPPYLLEDMDP